MKTGVWYGEKTTVANRKCGMVYLDLFGGGSALEASTPWAADLLAEQRRRRLMFNASGPGAIGDQPTLFFLRAPPLLTAYIVPLRAT